MSGGTGLNRALWEPGSDSGVREVLAIVEHYNVFRLATTTGVADIRRAACPSLVGATSFAAVQAKPAASEALQPVLRGVWKQLLPASMQS